MSKDSLGDRMKGYENVQRLYLTRRTPTIIRLDGKAFHTFTRGFQRPCDTIFLKSMWDTAKYLCENIMGCRVAYTQSDEITLLLIDYDSLDTQPWFDKNVVKMISVSASMATMAFNCAFQDNVNAAYNKICGGLDKETENAPVEVIDKLYDNYFKKIGYAMFDSRVFTLPKEEVCNCFLWRQQDATRNAIEAVGQANFSHKELHKKTCNEIQEMLFQERGINFNDYPVYQKRGACIIRETYDKNGVERSHWVVDENIPIFSQDRGYIERFVVVE